MTRAGGLYLPVVEFKDSGPGNVVPQETLNQTATAPAEQQAQCAAYNTVIPVWYGTGRLGARIADPGVVGNDLVVFAVWGRGPHDALVRFTIDDKDPPASISATHYDGTQSAPDPVLAQLYGSGYADVLPGIVYSVIRIPRGVSSSGPTAAAIWRGRLLYDPRTDTVAWSDNRALWLADFLASPTYGAGRGVIMESVIDAAEACAELVGGQPRRCGGGVILDTRQETEAWVDTLRAYAGCSLVDEGGMVRLIPNRPRAPVFHFKHSEHTILSMEPLSTPELADIPTVVEVRYTDTSQLPWREVSAYSSPDGLPPGGQPYRLCSIGLPGIHDDSQGRREAIEYANTQSLCQLTTTIEAPSPSAVVQPGDIVLVTFEAAGIADKEFLVTSRDGALGRYKFGLKETDPAQWSDALASSSTQPDTIWPDPADPPAPTGLAVVEETYQLDDGRWSTRLRITWDEPEWVYLRGYRVVVKSLYVVQAEGTPEAPVYVTSEVREDVPYDIEVYSLSAYAASAAATISITPAGKALLPTNITSISAYEAGGLVIVTVGASIDKDLAGIEARWGAPGVAWAEAKLLDFRACASGVGVVMETRMIPAGTWDILACGRDTNHYSAVPARCAVTVTLDDDAFLVGAYDHTSPTLSNMEEYRLGPLDKTRYFVSSDGVALSSKLSGALSLYSGPLVDLHAPMTSEWLGEPEDFGLALGGNWAGDADVSALSGTVTSAIGLSDDAAAWDYADGLSRKAVGRFARLRHTSDGAMQVRIGTQRLRVDATAKTRRGTVTTLATGGALVEVPGDWAAIKELRVYPVGSADLNAVRDSPTVGAGGISFYVYLFETGVGQVAGPVDWVLEAL